MLENVLQIADSWQAGGNVYPVDDASLNEVFHAFLFHVPAHKYVRVHSEDEIDQQGQDAALVLHQQNLIEQIAALQVFSKILLKNNSFHNLCCRLRVIQFKDYPNDLVLFGIADEEVPLRDLKQKIETENN